MQHLHPESSAGGGRTVSDTRIGAGAASDTRGPAMTSLSPRATTSTRWRRIVPAAVCAAALSATLTISAIASAAPREWDIEAYDKCTDMLDRRVDEKNDPDTYMNGMVACCTESGGVWSEQQGCVAPPAEVRPGQVRPGLTPLPGVTLQPATPTSGPPPAARNLPTFAPSTG
jgi:hypothetical protein